MKTMSPAQRRALGNIYTLPAADSRETLQARLSGARQAVEFYEGRNIQGRLERAKAMANQLAKVLRRVEGEP